ncbi:MAG: substrate-binding domain-containing protein [Oscillospiraceae bacterium]
MNITRRISISAAALATIAALAGCSGNSTSSYGSNTDSSTAQNNSTAQDSTPAQESSTGASKLDTEITVVSREDGSGTRGAFVELMGIEQKNEAGEKEDMTRGDAEIINSTNGVMMSVAGNVDAIGYISLGSLNDTVKAVEVNGVEVTVDNIKSGEYMVARPFNICYQQAKLDGNAAAADFVKYIMSKEGQQIIADKGYIAVEATESYSPSGITGAISVNGSTSVGPVMEKLAEAYKALNPDVAIDVQQTGSGAGITAATEGSCDIGMSSRDLKQEEIDAGLTPLKIADDGIAVIVNLENPVEDISSDEIMKIYTGEINRWNELA